jgi:Putative DNA-binding domain
MWDENRIFAVLEAGAVESLTLELKAELPGRSDKDKAEFLKDVSAMANAAGGTILFGIEERSAAATKLKGLRIEEPDAEIRRLAQVIESGLEPRLGGVRFTKIVLPDGDVLALDVPESFDSPHRFLFNGHSKFVKRMGTHITELSYDQLRAAFDRSSGRLKRIRSDWGEDFSLSSNWRPIVRGPVCVIRLSPLISADGFQVIDPKSAHEHWMNLIFPGWGGGSPAYNYQGFAVFPGGVSDELTSYVQVHRSGAITAYRAGRVLIDGRSLIPSTVVGNFFIEASEKLTKFAQLMGVAGAGVLNMGLRNLSGFDFATAGGHGFERFEKSSIDVIEMPEVWIENIAEQDSASLDEQLRPGFDLLWQTYGHQSCQNFDAAGRWIRI